MILLLILILTIITSGLALISPQPGRAKWISLAGSLLVFVLSVIATLLNQPGLCSVNFPMAGTIGAGFSLGMDGLSTLLVLLTTFLTPIIVLTAFNRTYRRPNVFFGLILLMEMALIGVFTARDGLMFYIFWELALIPIYFICGLWGSTDKIRITFKFFVYTLLGSLFMLVALISVYLATPAPHSFSFEALYAVHLNQPMQNWVFFAFFVAFAIKIPHFPFPYLATGHLHHRTLPGKHAAGRNHAENGSLRHPPPDDPDVPAGHVRMGLACHAALSHGYSLRILHRPAAG